MSENYDMLYVYDHNKYKSGYVIYLVGYGWKIVRVVLPQIFSHMNFSYINEFFGEKPCYS